jgi:putative transposase
MIIKKSCASIASKRRLSRMSGKDNCYHNAAVLRRENSPLDCFLILLTFFKTIKA